MEAIYFDRIKELNDAIIVIVANRDSNFIEKDIANLMLTDLKSDLENLVSRINLELE